MFISATYVQTGEQFYVNTDFIVDICRRRVHQNFLGTDTTKIVTKYIAYTFDNERREYEISKSDFEKLLGKGQNLKDIKLENIKEEVKKEMVEIAYAADGDTEAAHMRADALLCAMLVELGYDEIVEVFMGMTKRYA
jgi:hypothetical protein